MTLDDFGLNAVRLLAGFSGGTVYALATRQKKAFAVGSSALVGTLTANYFGAAAEHYLGSTFGGGGAAFLVGLCAMGICQRIPGIVQARLKTLNGGKQETPQ